jgi:uncharacterized protein YjdB
LIVGCSTSSAPKSAGTTTDCTLQSITVSPPSATLHVGDTLRGIAQTPSCRSNQMVETFWWRTSDTSVAAVDSVAGLLRAKHTGTATVIATATSNPAILGAMALVVVP